MGEQDEDTKGWGGKACGPTERNIKGYCADVTGLGDKKGAGGGGGIEGGNQKDMVLDYRESLGESPGRWMAKETNGISKCTRGWARQEWPGVSKPGGKKGEQKTREKGGKRKDVFFDVYRTVECGGCEKDRPSVEEGHSPETQKTVAAGKRSR